MDCSPQASIVHGISQVRNIGVSCHFLLQVIIPIQESNLSLMHCSGFFTTESLPGKSKVCAS